MKPANYAPVYAAALYPQWAEIAREHGYALAVHGSLARDFDLIYIPWTDAPSEPQAVIDAITTQFSAKEVGGPPSAKPHGRTAFTLSIGFGECFADLSFMPRTPPCALTAEGAKQLGPVAECPRCKSPSGAGCINRAACEVDRDATKCWRQPCADAGQCAAPDAGKPSLSAPVAAPYQLLGRGDIIRPDDEVLADDTVTWLPLVGWEVGSEWGSNFMPMRRRAHLSTALTGAAKE